MSYDPTVGRWVEQDPAGYIDGPNRYQFEDSSPVSGLDPSGLDPKQLPPGFPGARPTTGPGSTPDNPTTGPTQPALPGNGPPIIAIMPKPTVVKGGKTVIHIEVFQNDGTGKPAKDKDGNYVRIGGLKLQIAVKPGDDGGDCVGTFGLKKFSKEHGSEIILLDTTGDGVGQGADIVLTGTDEGKATLLIRLKDYPQINKDFPVTVGPPPIQ